MQNTYTGEVKLIPADHEYVDNPPDGWVTYRGSEDDVRRVATDVQRRVDRDAKRAKRKAQRQARKRNR